MTYNLNKIIL